MFKSIANSLRPAAVIVMPLALSACDGNTNNGPTGFEIVLIPMLLCSAMLARDWMKKRSILRSSAAQPA